MRWTLIPKPPKEQVLSLAKSLSVDGHLATLLLQRNIKTFEEAKTFFRPSLSQLHDPFLMKDMQKAVDRIEQAISKGEKLLVYGDYDVDGTTAVSLVATYLKTIYPEVATYIPDRYEEGYGISYQGIDFAEDNGISIIIALDCGIKALDKIDYATKKGIDFIICDHHRPGLELPAAVAVLDPKRQDCTYPFKELSGCGIGFKLVQALEAGRGQNSDHLLQYLDLVATAIAADIVPMNGENRTLAYFGLEQINTAPRLGIKAIIEGLKKEYLTITDVVFIIAPRINAAGRMKHGNQAVELLVETHPARAKEIARAIDSFNSERRDLDKKITLEALEQIKENGEEEHFTSVVYKEDWHKGVIGIVASRLIETYYRPTLVFTKNKQMLAASARSVRGFDVYKALEASKEFIEQFGGHKYAAGLTLEPANFEKFKSRFEDVVKKTIPKELLTPEIKIDLEIGLEEINPKFYRVLSQFGPFGPQNMKPVFMTKGVKDTGLSRKVGEEGKHLKMSLMASDGKTRFDAIGFNLGHQAEAIAEARAFDLVYTLEKNTWNGNTTLQLNVRDIKVQ